MPRSTLALVALAALALSACGGDPESSGSPAPNASASASPTSGDPLFEPDPAAAGLGAPAPFVLIKTGSTWLYLVNVETDTAERIDISELGAEGNNTMDGDLSWDGSSVAFDSAATDIVAGDTNGFPDVFLRHVAAGSVARVSQTGAGEANDGSYEPRISADGTTLVFTSYATNLVASIAKVPQVYRYDVVSGQISLVQVGTAAGTAYSTSPAISAGGRYLAYASSTQGEYGDDNFYGDVFVLDTTTGVVEQASVASDGTPGDFLSGAPSISLDGGLVAFHSEASNLVGDDANTVYDVFVRDRATGETTLVSRGSSGLPGNGDSRDPLIARGGAGVVFGSQASDLVAGDTNNAYDVFYADLATGAVTRLSVGPGGAQADADSFPDAVYGGRYLVFYTFATNLGGDGDDGPMRQYILDLETGALNRFI